MRDPVLIVRMVAFDEHLIHIVIVDTSEVFFHYKYLANRQTKQHDIICWVRGGRKVSQADE